MEPGVGQGTAAVGVDYGGEQGQVGALGGSRGAAGVPVGEVGQGLAAAFLDPVQELVGDADGRIEVADIGLVVPEQGQPAVAADAVQAELDDLVGALAGGDDGLPRIPISSKMSEFNGA